MSRNATGVRGAAPGVAQTVTVPGNTTSARIPTGKAKADRPKQTHLVSRRHGHQIVIGVAHDFYGGKLA